MKGLVILMELVELWNIRTFICHLWKTFTRFSNMPTGHVRLLRRILYVPRIIHVLHVVHVLPLEYRMRVSASNFSGYSSYLASIQPFSAVSHTSRSFMRVFLTATHIMSANTPFNSFSTEHKTASYVPQSVNYMHAWRTGIKLGEYITSHLTRGERHANFRTTYVKLDKISEVNNPLLNFCEFLQFVNYVSDSRLQLSPLRFALA